MRGLKRGDTWTFAAVWESSPGEPMDLTGAHARMQFRKSATDPVARLTLSDETGEIVLGGEAGTLDFVVLPAVTRQVRPMDYYVDLELTLLSGVVESSDTFVIRVEADQTLPDEES